MQCTRGCCRCFSRAQCLPDHSSCLDVVERDRRAKTQKRARDSEGERETARTRSSTKQTTAHTIDRLTDLATPNGYQLYKRRSSSNVHSRALTQYQLYCDISSVEMMVLLGNFGTSCDLLLLNHIRLRIGSSSRRLLVIVDDPFATVGEPLQLRRLATGSKTTASLPPELPRYLGQSFRSRRGIDCGACIPVLKQSRWEFGIWNLFATICNYSYANTPISSIIITGVLIIDLIITGRRIKFISLLLSKAAGFLRCCPGVESKPVKKSESGLLVGS